MLLKYKKTINFLIIILITAIVCLLFNFSLPLIYRYSLLRYKETIYLADQNLENWLNLCDELSNSEEYTKILKFFPDYLESDELYMTYFLATENNTLAALKFVNGYRYIYANALLNMGMYNEFEDYVYQLNNIYTKNSIQSSFYMIISDYILASKYNDEELTVLLNIIDELYNNCATNELKYQNLCIQSYINSILDNEIDYESIQMELSLLSKQLRHEKSENG